MTVNFVIRLKCGDPHVLLKLSLLDFVAILNRIFVKPTLFSLGYDYYASTRMVASQLNHQIILLLKRPLTHYWTSPLMKNLLKMNDSSFLSGKSQIISFVFNIHQ